MEKVISPDGTPIAFYQGGAGPPLILVHGTGNAFTRWNNILLVLERHFRVLAIDRRGRGESGDAAPYAIEREFEDIAAVAASIDGPVHLLGHSFGALCALEAALMSDNIHKLVLYEPAISLPGVSLYPEVILQRLLALLEAGDQEGVLTLFYREVAMVSAAELEQIKSSPTWPARVAVVHTVLRESIAEEEYAFAAQRFQGLYTPTLLLQGGDSPQFLKAATEAVHTALPVSRIAVLPGQGHFAMDSAPDLFLGEVVPFLS